MFNEMPPITAHASHVRRLLALAGLALLTAHALAVVFDPRPSYHLTYNARSSGNFTDPPLFVDHTRSFMNDPNGLLKFKGRYHVFAQWGMGGHSGASWLHAVSSDLAVWQMLP